VFMADVERFQFLDVYLTGHVCRRTVVVRLPPIELVCTPIENGLE
jgi:hypothetical protein